MSGKSIGRRWGTSGLVSARSRWFSGCTPPASKRCGGGLCNRNPKPKDLLYSSPPRVGARAKARDFIGIELRIGVELSIWDQGFPQCSRGLYPAFGVKIKNTKEHFYGSEC